MASRAFDGLLNALAGYGPAHHSAKGASPRPAADRPQTSAILRLLGYYALLLVVLALLGSLCRSAQSAASPGVDPLTSVMKHAEGASILAPSRLALLTTLSMIAALGLAIPVAWVHSISKRAAGHDRSVAETLVILPVAVAAIVMIVQNSLPLAFSLAGIVAAVRFRNTLKDAADTVYVFVGIGIGLAAGVQAFIVATVMSALFSTIVLVMARLKLGVGSRPVRAQAPSDEPAAQRGPTKGAKALLVVRASPRKLAWRAVEEVLPKHAKRWKLLELPADAHADAPLEYRIRLKGNASPARLLQQVRRRGGANILGVELRLPA